MKKMNPRMSRAKRIAQAWFEESSEVMGPMKPEAAEADQTSRRGGSRAERRDFQKATAASGLEDEARPARWRKAAPNVRGPQRGAGAAVTPAGKTSLLVPQTPRGMA